MKKRRLDAIFDQVFGGNFEPINTGICCIEGGEGGDEGGSGEDPDAIPKPMLTRIHGIIHQTLNKKLDEKFSKFEAAQAESQATMAATIAEQVAASMAPKEPEKEKKGEVHSFLDSPEYKAMKKRDDEREAEVAKMKTDRAAEVSSQQRSQEKNSLVAALRSAGVEEARVRGAASLIINEDASIQRADSGEIVYRFQREGYHEDLSMEAGVKEFLGTDEGKTYLPPSGAGGTGNTGGGNSAGGNQSGGAAMTKDQAASILGGWVGQQ